MKGKHTALSLWVGIPLIVGVIAAAFLTGHLHNLWGVYVRGEPILEMSSSFDLGECEFGQTVEARFTVANRGRSELVLDEFRSNCACNAVEQTADGRNVRVDRLRLAPDEQTELVLKMVVRARVGEETRNVVFFRTNDPARPEASFVAVMKVAGGITVTPTSVLFGIVPVGTEVHQLLEIRDKAIRQRRIKRVISSYPDVFAANLLPSDIKEKDSKHEGGALLGRIRVSLRAHETGLVAGELRIFLDDELRPPDCVPVSARIAPLVEASPSTIVLPRESSSGPLYFASCICRSTLGKPLILTIEHIPPHISVRISRPTDNPSLRLVRVDWDGNKSNRLLTEKKTESVRLLAQVGEEQLHVEIPIMLHATFLK